MAQLGRHLPCKNEVLSLIPRTHILKKSGMIVSVSNPSTGETERLAGACGSLATQPSLLDEFQANERPCLIKAHPRNDACGGYLASTGKCAPKHIYPQTLLCSCFQTGGGGGCFTSSLSKALALGSPKKRAHLSFCVSMETDTHFSVEVGNAFISGQSENRS